MAGRKKDITNLIEPRTAPERAKILADAMARYVAASFPEVAVGVDVTIPLEDVVRVMRNAGILTNDSTVLQGKRNLQGLVASMGGHSQPLQQMRVVPIPRGPVVCVWRVGAGPVKEGGGE